MSEKMKKYIHAVRWRLNLPKDVKERVISDFESSILARQEAGMTEAEIFAELGSAKDAAADLNEQMKEFAYRKSPWRFVFLAFALYGAAELLGNLIAWVMYMSFCMQMQAQENASIGIIGGADGPTAIFITTPDWMHYVVPVLLLVVGIWGFLRLRKCKQK